uniref:Coiled-coil serine rich protein 2 n=1 Tax=Leptobrachium leishanense TaxID=445787 RepID=A0A8C5PUE8_9ANUR
MEEKTQVRASPGSKLPKFGTSKPLGSLLQRPLNRVNVVLSGKGNFTGIDKHNGFERPRSLNWPRSKCQQNGQMAKDPPAEKVQERDFSLSYSVGGKDAPRAVGMEKTFVKQNNTLSSPREDLNENLVSGLHNAAKFTKSTVFGRTSYSALNGFKAQVNGFYSNKSPVGLQRPRANSATARNFSDMPTEHTKSFSRVRRSQSFSHSTQNPLLTSGPLTRTYSFNREVEISRPYKAPLVPTRVPPKSSLLARTARQYELPNDHGSHLKTTFARTFPSRLSSGLKAPGLPNGSTAPTLLGYKMNRPSLQRPNRTQFQREMILNGTVSSAVCSTTAKSEQTPVNRAARDLQQEDKKDPDIGGYVLCDDLNKKDSPNTYYSEDLDELSISSLSSSDKNDLSEDFSDDFVDLEEGNKTLLPGKTGKEMAETASVEYSLEPLKDSGKTILIKTDDWLANGESESTKSPYGKTSLSPDMDYRDHSSLELSPSDSSDGTYMWDEEGMEPIGSVHPCGSYESSEMNSLDILNNLDSCDLEDDDLMLDVDLPEDVPCDNGKGVENMSNLERTEHNLRQQQAFWKRIPPRQEQYHLINAEHYHNGRGSAYLVSPTEQEGFGTSSFYSQSPRATQMMGLRENTVMLDEMTLCHMVQDCTSVKTQLLKLKRLLQQEDGSGLPSDLQLSVPSSPEPQEPDTPWKTEELLHEIRRLKDDARKKDETIKHLEQQLKTRCKCQRAGHDSRAERPRQTDKYTQTSWRRNSSGYSAPSFSPWHGSYQGGPRIGPPHRRQRVEELVHYFSDKACLKYYSVPATSSVQTTLREN